MMDLLALLWAAVIKKFMAIVKCFLLRTGDGHPGDRVRIHWYSREFSAASKIDPV